MVYIYHRIAGITFRTESSNFFPFFPEEIFNQFRVSSAEADVFLRIHIINASASICDSEVKENTSHLMCSSIVQDALKRTLERPGQAQIELNQNLVIIRNYARCEYDHFFLNEREGQVIKDPFATPEARVSAGIRQIISVFLPKFSAILVHSAALVVKDKAALFLAPSGGGKSTTIGLSLGDPILNDDRVILRKEKDEIFAYSTPFGRVTSGSYGARLGGIFILKKAKNFKIKRVNPNVVLEAFFSSLEENVYSLPIDLRVQLTRVLRHASLHTPIYNMDFPKDYIDWNAIEAAMRV
jgi:hypothetical protein